MTAAVEQTDELFNRVHHLIKHGDIPAIRSLLDQGLSPNFANKFGWTILMLSASEGNTALGELLISRGADVNLSSLHQPHGQTPFSCAVWGGRVAFIKLLLAHGAIPDSTLEGWLSRTTLSPKQAKAVLVQVRKAQDRTRG
jgi:ankyrin repeat protein